ncbi:MAG: polysaccharide pyruvyl transferase family protein [Halobacteriales archaeon]|nr:polysaccharide pyruvyl transferase family protein [Halobacteriales archaeon]
MSKLRLPPAEDAPRTLAAPTADEASLEGERVLLIGGYGVGNLGDEAILAGLIQQHDLWDATVVSLAPEETTALHGVHAVPPLGARFARALARSKVVVVGGGGIFSAYMGPLARGIPWAVLAARGLRKQVEFRALGVYPGTPRPTLRVLARAAEGARYISVRDATSLRTFRDMGVRRAIDVVPDPALALEPASPELGLAALASGAPGLRGPFVAFGVRQVRDPQEQVRLEAAVAGLGTVLVRAGIEPLFIPFSRHRSEDLEDDEAFARRLIASIGAGRILDGLHHPREILALLQQAQCVVAVRFHALVFALRAGVPVVSLPYDAKCSDLLSQLGQEGLALHAVTGRQLAERVLRTMRPVGSVQLVRPGALPKEVRL